MRMLRASLLAGALLGSSVLPTSTTSHRTLLLHSEGLFRTDREPEHPWELHRGKHWQIASPTHEDPTVTDARNEL